MRRLIPLISVGWLPPYLFPSGAYPLTFVEGPCSLQSGTRVTPLTVAAPLSDPWILIANLRAQLSCATGCASASGTFLVRVPEIMATTIPEILACLKEGQNGGIVAEDAGENAFRATRTASSGQERLR